ncbi:unnamed protein product [Paramecium octaurelia]|uniref:Uncharacterized protein n=1 Tax=Paramecium octaurelia TaxID=43137 RepID=A0A8S1TD77_PAROT|nr:unnamed protein product [Paramecium octaurelia]
MIESSQIFLNLWIKSTCKENQRIENGKHESKIQNQNSSGSKVSRIRKQRTDHESRRKDIITQNNYQQMKNQCDNLIYKNESLNDELQFERHKFQNFPSFDKRDFIPPNFQEQIKNLKKKLEVDFKNNNQFSQELERIICNKYETIIQLDLDKQKLLTKLKLQTNSCIIIQEEDSQQNVYELQQNLEQSRKQIKKQNNNFVKNNNNSMN